MTNQKNGTLEKDVVGKTLEVYLHLLKVKNASEREVYHALDMSSPYLATYHLNKLLELNLASKDASGVYHVHSKRFGVLHFFVVTGRWLVPRTVFYAVFHFTLAISFLLLLAQVWNLVVFALLLIPAFLNVFETAVFYKALRGTCTTNNSKSDTS